MRSQTVLLVLLLGALAAGEVQAQAAGAFSRMGFGARGVAMGNALVADGFGDTSPYYNPALAPFTSRQHVEASAAFMSFDRELQFLQFATPLRPRAGIAAGLIHAGVTGIDGRDFSGYHTQDYSTDEFAFFLAFGTRIGERATIGIGLQLFRTDYFEDLSTVNSIGIDLGLTFQVSEALRLGVAADDLLARYSWDTSGLYGDQGKTTSDPFPRRIRVGAAYRLLDGRAVLTGEYESRVSTRELRTRQVVVEDGVPLLDDTVEDLQLHTSQLRLGAEYHLVETFSVRGGVDHIGVEGLAPSAGFMVQQPIGQLVARAGYTFVLEPYGTGGMHLLTLRVFL